jgi:hypothetical protein
MARDVTMQTIVSRWDPSTVLWTGEASSLKAATEHAVATGANLEGANLRGANLEGAKDLRLPTGETWEEYLTETVPALLTAGGKALESFAPHWTCHTWDNCPIAHAFDVHRVEDVPILFRPRAQQFIEFYDAQQIPWPLPTRPPAARPA